MKRGLLLTLGSLVCLAMAQESARSWGRPTAFATVADSRINESSGIAPSLEFPGEYLTHNDSGDTARFFRFDAKGAIKAEYALAGVKATDWEDMASARLKGKNYVFLADIGDNNANRDSVKIYRLIEPKGPSGTLDKFDTFEVTYPGGARNAEAMMIDPKTGDIWVVQKGNGQGGIYRLRSPKRSGRYTFEMVGKISFPDGLSPMRLITGGAAAPDGKHLVLRTYAYAYEFEVPGRDFASWLTTSPKRLDVASELQGEAICYSTDGSALLTTSEGTPCPVSRIPLK